MTRLLFIGNSHLAAVKLAWEQAAPKGFDTEFFGAPQRAWQRMALLPDTSFGLVEGGDYLRQRKITEEANGKVAVSLANRDVILLVGDFSAAEPLAALLADCDVPDLRDTGAPTLLSEPLFARACASMAAACLPEPGWLNRPNVKLAALPRPAPAETCLTSSYPGYQLWHRLAANPAGLTEAFDLYDTALTGVMAAQGLTYLPQPAETRTAAGLTAAQYLAPGGGNLPGQDHKRGDHAHMNAAYGAAVVAHILTWLKRQS